MYIIHHILYCYYTDQATIEHQFKIKILKCHPYVRVDSGNKDKMGSKQIIEKKRTIKTVKYN